MSSKGVNKAIIVGNLGEDPKTQYMNNGNAVTNISVATSEVWLDKQGQKQEKTEWHRISAFGKLAEIMAQYLKKGSKVYVEGRLETKKYQAQDGSDRYSTSIIANEMQMLDSRGAQAIDSRGDQQQSQQQSNQQGRQQGRQQGQQNNQQGYQDHKAREPALTQSSGVDDFDDSVPF